jgi:hypothetical protein
MRRSLKFPLLAASWIAWAVCVNAVASFAGPPPGEPSAPAESGQASNAPTIQIPETSYDFGEVFEGEKISHDFKVKNTGAEPLEITQVKPG